jgi:uncharacterized protein YndB with AHSA1/START domain
MNTGAWPPGLDPAGAPVYTRNELTVTPDPAAVWAALVDAQRWPDWYGNAHDVHVEGGGRLTDGALFRWTTFGVRVRCVIDRWEPGHLLGWTGAALGSRGHHRWILHPATGGGSHVVTEEVQAGLLPTAGRWWLRRGLYKWHQRWLEGLNGCATR